jgi:hypothetical protein
MAAVKEISVVTVASFHDYDISEYVHMYEIANGDGKSESFDAVDVLLNKEAQLKCEMVIVRSWTFVIKLSLRTIQIHDVNV